MKILGLGVVVPQEGCRRVDDAMLSAVASGAFRRANRHSRLAMTAAMAAVADAGGNLGVPPERVGLVIGTALGPHDTTALVHNDMMDYGDGAVSPMSFSHSVHNVAAAYVGQLIGIRGPSLTVTDFMFAPQQSLLIAGQWLRQGRCDRVIVGYADISGPVFDHIEAASGGPFAEVTEEAFFLVLARDEETGGHGRVTEVHVTDVGLPVETTKESLARQIGRLRSGETDHVRHIRTDDTGLTGVTELCCDYSSGARIIVPHTREERE